jgi:hypothetical protein
VDLAAVTDRFAIDELLNRFARAIDTKQFDLLDEVFTPDAAIDYTRAGGITAVFQPDFKAWVTATMAAFTVCQHLMVNRDVLLDGDTARVHSYLYNPLGAPAADGTMQMYFVGAHYTDDLVRTPDGWRIAGRVAEIAWTDGDVPDAVLDTIAARG